MTTNKSILDEKKLEEITFVETLAYYDGPLTYVFLTRSNKLCLAHLGDIDNDGYTYLITPTAEEPLKALKENKISIRDFFKPNRLYLAREFYEGFKDLREVSFDQLSQDKYIPEDGVYLDFEEEYI